MLNKEMFLKELEKLLSDLSPEEKREAMTFYEEYFLEAGEEKEADVIRELGSPQEVSYKIHDELTGKELACVSPAAAKDEENETKPEKKEKVNGWKIACIVLVCMLLLPIVIPLAIAAVAVVAGLLIAFFAVLLGILIGVIGFVVAFAAAGVAFFILGITKLLVAPFASLILLGVSFVLLGMFVLISWLLVKIIVVILPAVIKAVWKLICMPFRKKEGARA